MSGHSAGGYLTSMVGLDKRWLAAHDVDADNLAGLIPYSGHTITHFTVRAERGIDGKQPLWTIWLLCFTSATIAHQFCLSPATEIRKCWVATKKNAYMWRMMQVVKHPNAELFELEGYDHGGMAKPAHPLLLKFVKAISKDAEK